MNHFLGYLCTVVLLAFSGCGANHASEGKGCDARPGELLISEVMVNPVGDDKGREWFEIYNASSRTLTLDRLYVERLSADRSDVVAEHAIVGAGALKSHSFFVLGDGSVGNDIIDYSYGVTHPLGNFHNSLGGLALHCQNQDIDSFWYDLADQDWEGVSLAVEGVALMNLPVKEQRLLCRGSSTYDQTNLGSPGLANDVCGRGFCRDPIDGQLRERVAPLAGELLITEVMSEPIGTGVIDKQWIELKSLADRSVDLNTLHWSQLKEGSESGRHFEITATEHCLTVNPGANVVVGRVSDSNVNGGVIVAAVAAHLDLYNGVATSLTLWDGESIIDRASLPPSVPATSSSLNRALFGTADNDDSFNFCAGYTEGLFDGYGTPGRDNDACGALCRDSGGPRLMIPPTQNTLVITEIFPDPAGADNSREWFEIRNAGSTSADLNNLWVENFTTSGSKPKRTLTSEECLTISPNSYVVIGGTHTAEDGVSVLVSLAGLELYNSAATLRVASDDGVYAEVSYETVVAAHSYSFDESKETPLWCASDEFFPPLNIYASPGQANPPCGQQ